MNLIENYDSSSIKGIVEVRVINRITGEIEQEIKNNLIVYNARVILRNLISGASNSEINILKFGDMNIGFEQNLSDLPPPLLTDIDLVHTVFQTNTVSKEDLIKFDRPAVKFNFSISPDEANSSNLSEYSRVITEAGLFTTQNELFARITLPIIKTRDSGIELSWTIVL